MLATATVTSKGQVTVPIKVRQKLGVNQGDQIVFVEEGGRFYVENATVAAFRKAQAAFAGVAEELGLRTEQDVVDMIKEIRRERAGTSRASDV
jgi:AbrB family looped-hinge helix DNA binding protein